MKGMIYALLGGAFITLQGVANTAIGRDIGSMQGASLTQLTGFIASLCILLFVRDGSVKGICRVKPLYRISGALGAIIIVGVMVFQMRGEMNPLHRLIRKSMITTDTDYDRREAKE